MAKEKVQADSLNPEDLRKLINKEFGDGTMRFADDPYFAIKRIPSGVLSLDYLLRGGFPRGRHVEVYGGFGAGKTTIAYNTIASAQRQGLNTAFVDVEATFDPEFAKKAGVELKKLALHRQEHGEKAIDFIESLLRGGDYGVIVLDSIAALLPKTELEGTLEEGGYNMHQAKLMSKALRKLTAANESTVLIYINQMRDSIGSMFSGMAPTGGRAMGFYASLRLQLTKVETLKRKTMVPDAKKGEMVEKDLPWGHRVLVRVDKGDKAGGARDGEIIGLVFNQDLPGFDPVEDLIYLCIQWGWIRKKGTRWMVDGYEDQAQNGRDKFVKWLRQNQQICDELKERIMEADRDDDEEDE